MKHQYFTVTGAAAGMLILILDTQTALSGARDGIELCIRSLIPSLFPFFVLSSLLTGSLVGQPLPLLRPIGKLCGIPPGGESLMAVGMLGGYPVGAQNIGTAFRCGKLDKADAERMLMFCNNAGPAFIFGIIGSQFSDPKTIWCLWLIHMASALLVGILTREQAEQAASPSGRENTVSSVLEQSVRVMASVCGWVVIFRIWMAFLERWFLWLLPESVKTLLIGILELSNGCLQLAEIENEGLRFVIAGVLLSFGGICVTMQTASAATGLSLKRYVCGKLLQCCFSFFLCTILQIRFPIARRFHCHPMILFIIAIQTIILIVFLLRNKKSSRFPAAIGV